MLQKQIKVQFCLLGYLGALSSFWVHLKRWRMCVCLHCCNPTSPSCLPHSSLWLRSTLLEMPVTVSLLLLPRSFLLDVHTSGSHEQRRLLQGRKVAVQLLPQGRSPLATLQASGCPGVGSPGVCAQCPWERCHRGTSVSVLFSSWCTDVPSSFMACSESEQGYLISSMQARVAVRLVALGVPGAISSQLRSWRWSFRLGMRPVTVSYSCNVWVSPLFNPNFTKL